MKKNYISPSTEVIRDSLNGVLMASGPLDSAAPDTEPYSVTDDFDNWF